MNNYTDVLSQMVFMGTFVLTLLTYQSFFFSFSNEMNARVIQQEDIVQMARIFDYDLQKIGYGNMAAKMKPGKVDSTELFFYSDIDNNGTTDSVYYYLSNVSALSSTTNPNDRILYRKVNTGSVEIVLGGVVNFHIEYFDSVQSKISYASLNTSSGVNKVKSLKIQLKTEYAELINEIYPGASVELTYYPNGLNIN